jgi:hypothetical protein
VGGVRGVAAVAAVVAAGASSDLGALLPTWSASPPAQAETTATTTTPASHTHAVLLTSATVRVSDAHPGCAADQRRGRGRQPYATSTGAASGASTAQAVPGRRSGPPRGPVRPTGDQGSPEHRELLDQWDPGPHLADAPAVARQHQAEEEHGQRAQDVLVEDRVVRRGGATVHMRTYGKARETAAMRMPKPKVKARPIPGRPSMNSQLANRSPAIEL